MGPEDFIWSYMESIALLFSPLIELHCLHTLKGLHNPHLLITQDISAIGVSYVPIKTLN